MKRWLLRLLYVVVGLWLVLIALGLFARGLIGEAIRQRLESSLSGALGVPVSIQSARLDFAQWLRLRPAISLQHVTVGNLLKADAMSAQVELLPLLRHRVAVRSIRIAEPRITVERNARGETNLENLLKTIASRKSSGDSSLSVAIDELVVSSGAVTAPGLSLSRIDLDARDLSRDRQCRFDLSARLFGKNSGFRLEGRAGPFRPDSLPVDGSLAATIAPEEIPPADRRAEFGDFLSAPGPNARATLSASVKGDLYGTVAGPAKLQLSDVLIGRGLPLAGSAPAEFSAARLMAQPALQVSISKATLRVGHGEWTGGAKASLRGRTISGAGQGAIRNLDINELLSGLTSAQQKIYGALDVPAYKLSFAGSDASQFRNSLEGSGRLSIAKGRLAALDLLASIEQALSRRSEAGAKGATPFSTLTADVGIARSQIQLSNIVLDGPALRFTGQGAIGFDQALQFALNVRVGGTLAQTINRLTGRGQTGEALLPVTVSGTVGSPQVRPNIGKLATGAAEELLRSILKPK